MGKIDSYNVSKRSYTLIHASYLCRSKYNNLLQKTQKCKIKFSLQMTVLKFQNILEACLKKSPNLIYSKECI